MAKISRLAGSTSEVWTLFVQDSASTTGGGLTGLAYNAAGLTCYYKRNTGTASVAVTLASITTLGTYVSGGLKEVDATNMPGVYEFHPPNTAIASGAKSVAFVLKGATNLAPVPIEVELTAVDNQDATAGGISRIDAAITSRLAPTVASRTLDVSATGEAGIDLANVGSPTATLALTGTTISTGQAVASVAGAVGSVTGAVGSVTGNVGGNVTGNVTGNVAGKVLGGGSGTITGTGVNASISAVDASLTADGTAQAGATSSITLASSSATPTDYYGSTAGGRAIEIVAGTGVGQSRKIVAYNGTSKVATVDVAWATVPDNTSKYALGPYSPAAAGGGGSDPLLNAVPASYASGTAGYVLGHLASSADLGTLISTTPALLPTTPPANYPTATTVAAIKAKTDNLPASFPANFPILSIEAGTGKVLTANPASGGSGVTDSSVTAAVWAASTRSLTDKAGFSLGATGLDSIAVTDPGAPSAHTTFPKLMVALYRRFYKKVGRTPTVITLYKDDGTTANATQAVADNGTGTQTVGSAS